MKKFAIGSLVAVSALALAACEGTNNSAPANETVLNDTTLIDDGNGLAIEGLNDSDLGAGNITDAPAAGNEATADNAATTNAS